MSCFPPWEQLFFGQVTSVRSPGDDLVPRVSQSFKLSKNCPKFIQYNSYTFSFIFYFLQGQFSWIKDRELDEKSTDRAAGFGGIDFFLLLRFIFSSRALLRKIKAGSKQKQTSECRENLHEFWCISQTFITTPLFIRFCNRENSKYGNFQALNTQQI